MDAKVYLQSYGWREGEALQNGGLKKPILVKHKKDTKGLGHQTQDASAWWEQLFDGTLKNMEVTKDSLGGISLLTNFESVDTHMRKLLSPLYRMFVKGEGLAGTVGKTSTSEKQKFDAKGALKAADELFNVKKCKTERKEKKLKEKKEKKEKSREKKELKTGSEKKDKESRSKKDKIVKHKKEKSKDKVGKHKKEKSKDKSSKKDKSTTKEKASTSSKQKKDKHVKLSKNASNLEGSPLEESSTKKRKRLEESSGSKKRKTTV